MEGSIRFFLGVVFFFSLIPQMSFAGQFRQVVFSAEFAAPGGQMHLLVSREANGSRTAQMSAQLWDDAYLVANCEVQSLRKAFDLRCIPVNKKGVITYASFKWAKKPLFQFRSGVGRFKKTKLKIHYDGLRGHRLPLLAVN